MNMLKSIAASIVGAASRLGDRSCCATPGRCPGEGAEGLISAAADVGLAGLATSAGASAIFATAVIIAAAAAVLGAV